MCSLIAFSSHPHRSLELNQCFFPCTVKEAAPPNEGPDKSVDFEGWGVVHKSMMS